VKFNNLASKVPNSEMIGFENTEQSLKGCSKASTIAATAKHIRTLERENESKAIFVRAL
jgi:hypothetical protein